MSNCLAQSFFKVAMLCWGNQVSHFSLAGFIGTRRIIDCRKKYIIFFSNMNVNQLNFRMCFEWNFDLVEFLCFLYCGRDVFSNKFNVSDIESCKHYSWILWKNWSRSCFLISVFFGHWQSQNELEKVPRHSTHF